MKYVREHINEKFFEDSDPITDMSIGIVNQLKEEYLKKNTGYYGAPKTKEEISIEQLFYFCLYNNKSAEILEMLLEKGVNTNDINIVSGAIIMRGLDVLKLLLRYGLKLNKNLEEVAFSAALNNQKIDVADYLVDQLNVPIKNKSSLILRYSKWDRTDSVKWLVKRGADPNIYNYCVLRYALKNKNFELADFAAKEYIKKRNVK